MSGQPSAPFSKLEMFGEDEAAVCGPDGCALPPDEEAVDPVPDDQAPR